MSIPNQSSTPPNPTNREPSSGAGHAPDQHPASWYDPSFTHVADWVWMSPAPDPAVRVYLAVRAQIFDKAPGDRWFVDLTDAEIAGLIHKSPKSIQRPLQSCLAHGLFREVETFTRSSTQASGKHRVVTVRRIWVAHEPPEDLEGPDNCYQEVRHQRGVEHRMTCHHSDCAGLQPQSNQKPPEYPAEGSESADLHELHAGLREPDADLHEQHADLRGADRRDQGQRNPYLHTNLPPNLPSNLYTPGSADTDPQCKVNGGRDGRMEGAETPDNDTTAPPLETSNIPGAGTDQNWEKARGLLMRLPYPWVLNARDHKQLLPLVAEKLANGWHVGALLEWITDHPEGVRHPGRVLAQRIRQQTPDTPPVEPDTTRETSPQCQEPGHERAAVHRHPVGGGFVCASCRVEGLQEIGAGEVARLERSGEHIIRLPGERPCSVTPAAS